jgi:hypothetical protein
LAAYTFLAAKRANRNSHTTLSLLRLAQAEDKEVKKQFEDWEKEA